MSASLVGSEMCIRDSALDPEVGCSCWQVAVLARHWTRGLDTHRAAPVPVSYTHLTLPTICSV
eukprot:11523354-Alexandrium_andersonii.AAC.1